jgi:S1-C subfamily serine protease
VDGRTVTRVADVRVAMWDKQPGEWVVIKVQRKPRAQEGAELNFKVKLR